MPHYEQGTYAANVADQRFATNANDKAYFELEFEPTRALGANTFPDIVYRRNLKLYCTDKSMEYTIDKLRELGFNGTKFAQLDLSHPQAHSFVGQEINVVCSHSDDGKYENWDLAKTGGSSTPRESDPTVASRLDALFGKSLMATVPATREKTPVAKKAAAPSLPAADAIPF